MNQTIQCRFRWTIEEYITAQREYLTHDAKARGNRQSSILGAGFIMLVGVAIAVSQKSNLIGIPIAIACAYPLFSILFLTRAKWRRQYDSWNLKDAEIFYEFSPDGYRLTTPLTRFESAWTTSIYGIRTKRGFFLIATPSNADWIPASAFANAEDRDWLGGLLKRVLVKYRDNTGWFRLS